MIELMQDYRSLKKFKVLIGTPHADVKNYCLDSYVSNVKNLTYPNYEILVADNSETTKNQKNLRKKGVPTLHVKRKNKNTRQLIAESDEALREATLKGDYDFLLHWESDIAPPVNVIERLLSHQKSIVSGAYFIGQGTHSHLMVQDIEQQEEGIRETINLLYGADSKYMDGKLHEVYACGLGMTLIHRSVLENIKFRCEEGVDAHPDTFFAHDIKQLGMKQYLDTSIMCEHDNRDWMEIENK